MKRLPITVLLADIVEGQDTYSLPYQKHLIWKYYKINGVKKYFKYPIEFITLEELPKEDIKNGLSVIAYSYK